MAKQTLFPQRQRCSKCRKKLEKVVVSGMYCSYSCAGVPAPSRNVDDAPRPCKRQINGQWDFKKRYRCEEEVQKKLRDDPGTNIYRCEYCYHLHVGHSRPDPLSREKLSRKVGDADLLGDVLKRMREDKRYTVKQLATKLNVPQIRIKEVEEGSDKAHLDVAVRMVYALGCSLIIQER